MPKLKKLTPLKKIRRAAALQSNTIFERDDVVKGLWSAILAGEHLFMLGPPGTGKSLLLTSIVDMINGASVFTRLISKTTQPKEIFGPPSIVDLKNGISKTVTTGMLPEADFAYLDEIFKGSGAILNTLLTAINERAYENPIREKIPLRTMVCSSNELPDDDDGLTALFDRILLKYHVEYVKDESSFDSLLDLGNVEFNEMLTIGDLDEAQAEAMSLTISQSTRSAIKSLWRKLPSSGFIVSDRTWRKCLKVIKAHAWLHGRTEVEPIDLEILSNIFWTEPQQRPALIKIILSEIAPAGAGAVGIAERIKSVKRTAITAIENEENHSSKTIIAGDAIAKLTEIGRELALLDQSNPRVAGVNQLRESARTEIMSKVVA